MANYSAVKTDILSGRRNTLKIFKKGTYKAAPTRSFILDASE
jgi:hypothetical protein